MATNVAKGLIPPWGSKYISLLLLYLGQGGTVGVFIFRAAGV